MTPTPEAFGADEPWEADIAAMLGRLPPVEPPAGFIPAALDHRPLHSGRIMVLLLGLTAVAIGVSVSAGLVGDGAVIPEIDRLAQRHLAAQAMVPSATGSADDTATSAAIVPDGYERTATTTVGDIGQAVYARGKETVSVFELSGPLDWDALPAGGRETIGGTEAWLDDRRAVAVLEVGGEAIVIVGLRRREVVQLIEDRPGSIRVGWADRADDLASTIVGHLGFSG